MTTFTDIVEEVEFEIEILDNVVCYFSEVEIRPSSVVVMKAGSVSQNELFIIEPCE